MPVSASRQYLDNYHYNDVRQREGGRTGGDR